MPAHPDCPEAAELKNLLLGRVNSDRAGIVETHVGECLECQRKVDGLIANLRWLGTLRDSSPPSSSEQKAGLEDMIARVDDMAAQFSSLLWTDSKAGEAVQLQEEHPRFESSETAGEVGRLGPYRLLRLLGSGGMGLVYLAEDTILRRPVALKLLRPYLARLPHARNGFLSEARAMAAVKHDSIVTVFQIGETPTVTGETIPFLAMESLEGESLADWLRREGPLPTAWAARLGQQAAEGLAIAHARGVVHRDIKPGNLWLEAPRGWTELASDRRSPLAAVARLKILDFGLAQPAGNTGLDGGPVFGGTPAYMPPEQGRGEQLGPAADLFSLGVVLYQLVSGRLPFSHSRRLLNYRPPVPLWELVPQVPTPFAYLVHRLLALEPAARPASAGEVAEELAALAPPTGPSAPPRRSRRRALLATSGLVLLAVLATGTWFVLRPAGTTNRSETESPPVSLAPSAPPLLPGAPDEKWCRAVAALPAEQQPDLVVAKLRELNPDYDGEIDRLNYKDRRVTEFGIVTDAVRDIRPVRGFPALHWLGCCGSEPGKGRLTDLSPIRGMNLTVLNIWQNPGLSDLSATRGMKLTIFQAGDTAVEDLSPLQDMPLVTLAVNNCRVRDLAVARTLPNLVLLRFDGCPIATLEPLAGTSIPKLVFDYQRERGDAEVLRRMPKLEYINGERAEKFWNRQRSGRFERSVGPFRADGRRQPVGSSLPPAG
jgi:serine/threonine protein kinase